MSELDIVAIVTARLRGLSWNRIAEDYVTDEYATLGYTGQKLRRHVRQRLFPTRKRK